MAKVLVVTDYAGTLHITPIGNASFYLGRNQVIKNKQFKLKQMEEQEALDYVQANKGSDPNFVNPTKASELLADRDKEIEDLRKQLALLQNEPGSRKRKAKNEPKFEIEPEPEEEEEEYDDEKDTEEEDFEEEDEETPVVTKTTKTVKTTKPKTPQKTKSK